MRSPLAPAASDLSPGLQQGPGWGGRGIGLGWGKLYETWASAKLSASEAKSLWCEWGRGCG